MSDQDNESKKPSGPSKPAPSESSKPVPSEPSKPAPSESSKPASPEPSKPAPPEPSKPAPPEPPKSARSAKQPPKADPPPPRAKPSPPSRPPRRGFTAVLALILALIALAAVAFGGWRLWLLQQGDQAGTNTLAHLQQRVDALDATQTRQHQDEARVQKQLSAANKANHGLSDQIDGLSERARNLESAVAQLSASKLSAHDSMVLDETGALLRMADQRYTLFHDGAGALNAYTLAAQTLATVNDPAFSGVRQSIDSERAVLAATHPTTHDADLVALEQLRSELPSLPLRPLDTPSTTAPRGFWQRTWHVLSHVVSVTHDSGTPVNLADARLARELATIDAAQAQAALLAHDNHAMHAALKRVDAALGRNFDGHAASVQQARAEVARLQTSTTMEPVKLGAALDELRNVRRVRDAADTPAPATSTAPAQPAAATSTAAPAAGSSSAAAGMTQ